MKNDLTYKICGTYNENSCSQHGSAPLTVTVVHLTFCNLTVTYVFSWEAN